jgi:N-acetylmuramoyl-L-alanine amidase
MRTRHTFARLTAGQALTAALALAAALAASEPAAAQSAGAFYEQALAREQTLRAGAGVDAAELRRAAQAYERIVRRYPTSGYSDNALWQAAGLMLDAHARSSEPNDREQAREYLEWLQREYPHSPLRRDASARLAALGAPDPRPAAVARPAGRVPAAPADAASIDVSGPTALVRAITHAAIPRGERIVIELTREVPYISDRVDGPDRVFFDLAHSAPAAALGTQAESITGALVKQLRVGRHAGGVTRVVLDLGGQPRHSAYPLYNPFRLVIDLETAAPSSNELAAAPAADPLPPSPPPAVPPPPPASPPVSSAPAMPNGGSPAPAVVLAPSRPAAPTSNGNYSLARQLGLGVSRIVIDPGHGGQDPGASANGVQEAELVLDVARRLRTILAAQPGVEVMLTRDRDVFVPLEARTAMAREQHADLFLSIHANSSPRTATRGVETYVLNYSAHPEAQAVAARENASSTRSMGELRELINQIALDNKLQESRELATMVQTSLVRSLRARSSAVRDLGVKEAPFVVLIGAEMPSVLTEIAFLTNRAEAALLKEAAYRQRIAQAIADAILKYQSSLKKITALAVGQAAR